MSMIQTLNPYLTPILDEIDHLFSCCALRDEHQLIKHLQEKNILPFDRFTLGNAKNLISAYFLCMHALYHLK